jgi:hypothetical protein
MSYVKSESQRYSLNKSTICPNVVKISTEQVMLTFNKRLIYLGNMPFLVFAYSTCKDSDWSIMWLVRPAGSFRAWMTTGRMNGLMGWAVFSGSVCRICQCTAKRVDNTEREERQEVATAAQAEENTCAQVGDITAAVEALLSWRWPADTAAVSQLFLNCHWPAGSGGGMQAETGTAVVSPLLATSSPWIAPHRPR